MYEDFGAVVTGSDVVFRLFIPDNAVDSAQYTRGGLPRISKLQVTGTFQPQLGQTSWNLAQAPEMVKSAHPNGWLYSFSAPGLADGFYEYKYFVSFENSTSRWCSDPCSRYDGSAAENSAFVIGGNDMEVRALAGRKPISELVLYELMIDDFTAEFRGSRAPLDAIWDKLDYLDGLGVNGIEFMPWTAWPEDNFSWGYDPYAFFTVEHRYYEDPAGPLDKLFRLKRLIDELHRRGKHVIMDGVFNHVQAGQSPDHGFAYFWLYQDPNDSPYIGDFAAHSFFNDLDFANKCTSDFIVDVCKYWIDDYKVDGIRFDYALGYYDGGDAKRIGIAKVMDDLNAYAASKRLSNMSFILELLTDNRYAAIADTNVIGASGCWYDPFMWQSFGIGGSGNVDSTFVRALNSGKDFDSSRRPVTYIENHDHSTLTEQCGGRNVWWRSQPLAIALATISGAPMIHNGQEFGEQYWVPEDGSQRVLARPLRWARSSDSIGLGLQQFYRQLMDIRHAHPGLWSQNFYPDSYDEGLRNFNDKGYGIDVDRDVAIYHRWGLDKENHLERFIVVLNFSEFAQTADIPFPENGSWTELISEAKATVSDFWLRNQSLSSHWGRIYFKRD
jgi:pullulanase